MAALSKNLTYLDKPLQCCTTLHHVRGPRKWLLPTHTHAQVLLSFIHNYQVIFFSTFFAFHFWKKKIICKFLSVSNSFLCFFFQTKQPDTAIYHNRGIWPFVTAFWIKAAKKVQNWKVVNHNIQSIVTAAGLFLSNMENLEFLSGLR